MDCQSQNTIVLFGGNGDNETLGEVGTKSEGKEEETLHLDFEVYNTTFSWIACNCDFRLYIPNTDADERHIAKKQYHTDVLIFSFNFSMSFISQLLIYSKSNFAKIYRAMRSISLIFSLFLCILVCFLAYPLAHSRT